MTKYKSAADSAKIIRIALKAKGINSRRVSVRAENFSMGSAVRVSIKDHTISKAMVEKIANGEESIRRCEMSGEILSGGNRYISVDYSHEAEEAMAAPHLEAAEKAIEELKGKAHDAHAMIAENITIASDGAGHYRLWIGDSGEMHVWDAKGAASYTGRYLNRMKDEDAVPAGWGGLVER